MFERYTEKARRVVLFARYEASQYGSPYIETEHVLLGLMREDRGAWTGVIISNGYRWTFSVAGILCKPEDLAEGATVSFGASFLKMAEPRRCRHGEALYRNAAAARAS
jgi:hypothetical protein